MSDRLIISQLAGRVGLNRKTIRYYEEIGLIRPARTSNGYRVFSSQDEQDLVFIKRAKMLGLTLKEIALILRDAQSGICQTTQANMKTLLHTKIAEIDITIAQLTELKTYLSEQLDRIEGHTPVPSQAEDCSCLGVNK